MKKLITILLGTLLATLAVANPQPTSAEKSKQLLVITTSTWSSTQGQLQRFERYNTKDAWKADGAPVPAVISKQGLAWVTAPTVGTTVESKSMTGPVKKPGDTSTPAGIFPVGSAFGFGPSYIKKISLPYEEITQTTVCVNDNQSKYYGKIINTENMKNPDWKTIDDMRKNPQNLWGITIQDGPCFFLHIADKGTPVSSSSSIALPEPEIEHLITWLNPRKKPLVVILPKAEYKQLQQAWNLPTA